ncbi:MAG: hypothetical protein PWQ37_2575 [Candidatus Petromonas sp.]|jgi:hypothetical protein|uniref:Uncharacterized protein n=1 Tax=Geosporobacter subterraneus DSM 17957 TaxID=1121919 RepID=A0A1M6QDM8_9FIRM|nr:hypothetical protein [Geosporobacter subterraneus]MDK2919842.1 hypothetical protein [Candidatus Petromonas sp.]SHK18359.1 hypothetical protein SAMN02745975_03828 [Geosporobacter subterraneus DSM 17957]
MLLKPEEIYFKFNEESIEIKIPKKLLLVLLQQVNRHYEILKYEEEIINNFAIHENISNTEMIMAKLLILMAEPYDKKDIKFETSVAEFLVLRDLVYCNYSLLHLQTKMKSHMQKAYKEFYDAIESIYEMFEQDEVKAYWDYIKNYNIENHVFH